MKSFELIGISCAAYIITSVLIPHIKWRLKFKGRILPPLDCTPCLSFWMGLYYFFITTNSYIFAVLYAAVNYVLSILIEKYVKSNSL